MSDAETIYQHPLAYLLGLEGLALLRGWAGDFGRDFVLERLAEVRRLVAEPVLTEHPGVEVARGDTQVGYQAWAPTYDEQPNGLFAIDEPMVDEILDELRAGDALDAACGTGRLTSRLVERGHRTLGVDRSPEMLDVARRRIAGGDFRLGELGALPVEEASADLIVCGLALSHVADLTPVFADFSRVLRPGGHVVISDVHHELVFRGSVVKALGPGGAPGLVATYRHTPVDHLRAALAAGLRVRQCEELRRAPGTPTPTPDPGAAAPKPIAEVAWDDWPWSLLGVVPDAARAAWDVPSIIVWHFDRPS